MSSCKKGALTMNTNTIITIGRQFGSGGKEIGVQLAKELHIPYYDKELLKRAAQESGLCEELFESFDEKPTNSFLYSLVMDPYSIGVNATSFDMPMNHKIFLAAFDTIKKIADEGPCIMIGRCADYALADYSNCLNLFIHAPLEDRIARVSKRLDCKPDKAKDIIAKEDKKRASYYNYYTTKKWGNVASYDFCIDSSLLGIDGTVDLVQYIITTKEK